MDSGILAIILLALLNDTKGFYVPSYISNYNQYERKYGSDE